jgi:hypothetical protein
MNEEITNPYIKDNIISNLADYNISFDTPQIDENYINDYFNVEEKLLDPLKPDMKRYPTIKTCLESEWMKTHPFYEKVPRYMHYTMIKHYYITDNKKAKNPKFKKQIEHEVKTIEEAEEEGRRRFLKMIAREDRKKKLEADMKILEAFGLSMDDVKEKQKAGKKKKNKK